MFKLNRDSKTCIKCRLITNCKKMEIIRRTLEAVGTHELLMRLEASDEVTDAYREIVAELRRRGVNAEVPPME